MTTKIFVSQIDTTQPDGSTASFDSVIYLSDTGPIWKPLSALNSVGYTGSKGIDGYFGSVGYQGSTGEVGMPGTSGYKGSVGYTGSSGVGYKGSVGYTSSIGYTSSVGYTGSQGTTGYFGSLGYTGYFGSVGYQGSLGVGYRGSVGYQGSDGITGILAPFPFINLSDVADTNGNPYTGYNDYGGSYVRVKPSRDGLVLDPTVVLTPNITVNVDFQGNQLQHPVFSGYSENVIDAGISGDLVGASLSANPLDGNVITATLNSPITTITMTNTRLISGRLFSLTFLLKQDSIGGRILDWTNNIIYWSTGDGINQNTGPILSTQPFYTDIITVYTYDGGGSWYGIMGARGFPTP